MADAITLEMMQEVLKKAYAPTIQEILSNQSILLEQVDGPQSINVATNPYWQSKVVGKPLPLTEFEIAWDTLPKLDFRTPAVGMGLHITEVYWQDYDGTLMVREPACDAYRVTLVVHAVLIPGKASMSIEAARDIITEQVVDGVKGAFKMVPTPWKRQFKDQHNYPSTMLYSQMTFSGLEYHKAKQDGNKGLANFLCHVGKKVADQMVGFLQPRLDAGAHHDWMHDDDIKMSLPFKGVPLTFDGTPGSTLGWIGTHPSSYKVFTKEDGKDAIGGLQVS